MEASLESQSGKVVKNRARDESVQQLQAVLLALSVGAKEVIDKGGGTHSTTSCVTLCAQPRH